MILSRYLKNCSSPIVLRIFIASILALVVAYIAEFVFDLPPCILCIYQRIPYFILALLSSICLIYPLLQKILIWLIITALVSEVALAFYHVGIEHYIFEDFYTCSIKNDFSTNAKAFLAGEVVARNCSQVAFRFMNLSMAEWNLLYSFALLFWLIRQEKKNVTAAR